MCQLERWQSSIRSLSPRPRSEPGPHALCPARLHLSSKLLCPSLGDTALDMVCKQCWKEFWHCFYTHSFAWHNLGKISIVRFFCFLYIVTSALSVAKKQTNKKTEVNPGNSKITDVQFCPTLLLGLDFMCPWPRLNFCIKAWTSNPLGEKSS